MKIHPVLDKDGTRTAAFEVENAYISPQTIVRLLGEVKAVSNIDPRGLFGKSADVHVEFDYHGQPYMVWEPYGDSSRYWIGPKGSVAGTRGGGELEEVFSRYRPPFYRTLLGDLLTLKFITRYWKP